MRKMTVINITKQNLVKFGYKDFHDWNKLKKNIYIGRSVVYVGAKASKWANPFSIKEYGLEECLKKYKKYIKGKIKNKELNLKELKGKILGCWCKPNKCHGDILIKLLKSMEKK